MLIYTSRVKRLNLQVQTDKFFTLEIAAYDNIIRHCYKKNILNKNADKGLFRLNYQVLFEKKTLSKEMFHQANDCIFLMIQQKSYILDFSFLITLRKIAKN